ncbi:hypothetical protein ES703_74680 [subsurface metagenome]
MEIEESLHPGDIADTLRDVINSLYRGKCEGFNLSHHREMLQGKGGNRSFSGNSGKTTIVLLFFPIPYRQDPAFWKDLGISWLIHLLCLDSGRLHCLLAF